MAWFAMDVDAFLEDERMQTLTNREKGAWLLMLIRSFRAKGCMVDDPAIWADQTGLPLKDAVALLAKLFMTRLLVPAPSEERTYNGMSPRMRGEWQITANAYQKLSSMGAASAIKRGCKLRLVASESPPQIELQLQPVFEQIVDCKEEGEPAGPDLGMPHVPY